MTKEELKNKFEMLYGTMASSNEPKYMKVFGDVMKEMMCWFIDNKPDVAETYIETLCAIKWKQYLSRTEAMKVVSAMHPRAAWDYDTWSRAMENLGLESKREGVFNCYSLWVVMNAVYSDNGKVIADILNINSNEVGNPDFIKSIWRMAINMLCDEDEKYEVRAYFL